MKSRWCLFLAVLWLVLPAAWAGGEMHPSEPKMKETLQGLINQQLAAFRAEDYQTAYGFADPSIKAMFPVEAFEQMVKTGYPLIAKSTNATFGITIDNGDEAVVTVKVVGQNNETADYQYLLRRNGEKWCIGGVFKVEKQGLEV